MRTVNRLLAVLVSACVASPASAQVRAAASMMEGAVPRVEMSAPLISPSFGAAPSLTSSILLGSRAAVAAPLALPAAAVAAAAPALIPAAAASARAAGRTALPSSVRASAPRSARSPESARAESEAFWSGAVSRGAFADEDGASVSEVLHAPAAPSRLMTSARRGLSGAAAITVPAAHGFAGFVSHYSPFLEAGAVLAGTYVANRGVHALLSALGSKKGMDRHQVAAIRLVSSVVLWTAATVAALKLGGASPQMLTTVYGAGGTIMTLGLKDVLGNVIQGINFLVTRPFSVGTRVTIDDQTGVVSDVTLTSVVLRKDGGSEVRIRHAALAAKPVIVFGAYQQPDSALHLADAKRALAEAATPKFQGALSAVWKSLDRRFWIAGAAFGALLAAPALLPVLSAGWAATAVHYALAASIAWLTRRLDLAAGSAIDALAARNGWRPETRVIARLAATSLLWIFGGGSVLRLAGVSWTMLGASVGLTTLGVGLASNNFFGSVVQGGEVLFSKPFKVGDTVTMGTFSGTVEDMTLYHVVIKLDEGRHALVPYAVVRDATLVVTPGQNKQ